MDCDLIGPIEFGETKSQSIISNCFNATVDGTFPLRINITFSWSIYYNIQSTARQVTNLDELSFYSVYYVLEFVLIDALNAV